MAALASTFFSSTPKVSHSATANSIPKISLTKSLSQLNRTNLIAPIVASALRDRFVRGNFASELDSRNGLKKLVDSLLVLCASVALSASLFVADVDSASAFVVTTPRKLQTDELATVRLFQENTPSVVYITNLASRYYFFFAFLCFFSFFCLWNSAGVAWVSRNMLERNIVTLIR